MCGILGYCHLAGSLPAGLLAAALEALAHQGRDHHGRERISLGATGLRIRDLDGDDQGLLSAERDAVVVSKGESSGYPGLRSTLEAEGSRFETHSDTEVVLSAFLRWGGSCFSRFRGMAAIAIWVRSESRLIRARNRMGISAHRASPPIRRDEPMRRLLLCAVLLTFPWSWSWAQTLARRPEEPVPANSGANPSQSVLSLIPLTVPTGTPLKVVFDQEVRIQRVGQPVYGKIVEPVFAFDRLVVPAGTEVVGKISAIDRVPKIRRTLAAMNGEFSPSRQVHIEFRELVLADGRHMPLHTDVSPGSGGVLQFVSAGEREQEESKKYKARNAVSRQTGEVKKEVKRRWEAAKKQLHEPGKMHRLERLAVAQLPYHPQYMDPGSSFNADLRCPLDFGAEPLTPALLEHIGTPPPSGSVVHAVLVTPLGSVQSKNGDPVEAIITQPLVVFDHLFLPEGSRLKGSVLQARPARRFSRNGHLRIVFHQVVPPSGIEEKVEASLEGVEVAKGERLRLDSEGGAEVTTPKTRYLTTAVALVLASSSLGDSHDRDGDMRSGGGDVSGGANGASGFRLVGTIVGAFAHSRVVASGFGFYGAARSVYSHFLARGRDVAYPKDMSMMIGMGKKEKKPPVGGSMEYP